MFKNPNLVASERKNCEKKNERDWRMGKE